MAERAVSAWRAVTSHLGYPGACGVVALLAASWLLAVLVPQRETELAQWRARAAAAAQAPAAVGKPAPRAVAERFPDADTLPDWLERMHAAGIAAGVAAGRAEYRLASAGEEGLARHHIALPVRGTYAQVRGFIAGLLEAVPALAIADVELRRDGIASAAVEARLNATLYLRGEP